MKNLAQSLLGIALVGLLSACGQIQVSDDCTCGFYTVAGTQDMLHWRDGEQIHFKYQSSFPDVYRFAIGQIASEYNSVLKNTRIVLDEKRNSSGAVISKQDAPNYTDNPKSVSGDGVNGIYWVEGDWPWEKTDPNSDAMTVLSFSREGVIEADVFFKAGSFGKSTLTVSKAEQLYTLTDGFEITKADSESKWMYVIGLHEFGHVLGRVHSHDHGSVMYPSVGLSFVADPFPKEDLDILSKVYSLK